ncbi:MAG: double zinc ribbon domain-containing protein [Akkermansia sp.]
MAFLGVSFVCELCGRGGLDGCHVCPDCRGSFVPVEPPFCAVCGEPAEGSFIPSGLCRRCAAFLPLLRKPVPCM